MRASRRPLDMKQRGARVIAAVATLSFVGACTTALGVDFEGRLRANASDAGAEAGDAGANVDLTWSRWEASGDMPRGLAKNGDIVTDPTTGLLWPVKYDPSPVTFDDAPARCAALRTGDFDDWRVPTRIELVSIVKYIEVGPATDSIFDDTPADVFWTSSRAAASPDEGYAIDFQEGAVQTEGVRTSHWLRCVRAGRRIQNGPDYRFVVGAGTVFDRVTNLTWQIDVAADATFSEALAACQVNAARLPTLHELHTLVDERVPFRALAAALRIGPTMMTWSSTNESLDTVWAIDFTAGTTRRRQNGERAAVRCVR